MMRFSAVAMLVMLAVSSDVYARPHCRPRPFRDGAVHLMCSDDPDICMTLRDGDECNGLERSPECVTPRAMFCFAENSASGSSGIQCFAERTTCESVKTWVVEVEGGEASPCARVTNGTPYRLYRRIVPRR